MRTRLKPAFSVCALAFLALTASAQTDVSVSPSSGTGLTAIFQAAGSDAAGYAHIESIELWINPGFTGLGCGLRYDRGPQTLYVMNNSGTAWIGPIVRGTSGSLSSAVCTIDAAATTASGTGNSLSVGFAVTFTPTAAWSGGMNVYVDRRSSGGATSGYQNVGVWTVQARPDGPVNAAITPSGGTGATQTFQVTSSSVNGSNYVAWMQVIFNYGADGSGACYLNYDAVNNTLYLADDTASGWGWSGVLGSPGTIENSQCRVDLGASNSSRPYQGVTMNVALTFKSLPGPQNVYLQTLDSQGVWAYWELKATWTPSTVPSTANPTADSVTPSAGAGLKRTFSYQATSLNGYQYIRWMYVLINSAQSLDHACYIYYHAGANKLGLANDSGAGFIEGTPGEQRVLDNNSQCSLNLAASAPHGSGNTFTLDLAIEFKPAWAGQKNNYIGYVLDRANHAATTIQRGTWTVSAPSVTLVTSTGSGPLAHIQAVATDPAGGSSNIDSVEVWLNTGFTGRGCGLRYDRASGNLFVMNDAGTAWLGPVNHASPPAVPLASSFCAVSAQKTVAQESGNSLTVDFYAVLTPTGSWQGTMNVYASAWQAGGAGTGYLLGGTWTAASVDALPSNGAVTSLNSTGLTKTFSISSSSANGYAHILFDSLLVNANAVGGAGCFILYWPQTRTVGLAGDYGAPVATGALGSSQPLSNSQCQVDLVASSATADWDTVTVNLVVAFKPEFKGQQNVYVETYDTDFRYDAWELQGTWTPAAAAAAAPTVSSITPSSGTGMSRTFDYKVSSANGWLYLWQVLVRISDGMAESDSMCYVQYDRGTHTLSMRAQGGAVVPGTTVSMISPPPGATTGNSFCSIDVGNSSVLGTGNDLTLRLAVTFSIAWTGQSKHQYAWAYDRATAGSGWAPLDNSATWTVATAPASDFTLSITPATQSLISGNQGAYTVSVAPANGNFSGTVSLTATGLPFGSSCTNCPASVVLSGSTAVQTTLNIATAATTPLGSYSFAVIGTSSPLTHAQAATLTVQAQPDFVLTADTTFREVSPNVYANFTVTVVPLNGFSQNVNLSTVASSADCGGLPWNYADAVFPATLTPNVPATIKIRTAVYGLSCITFTAQDNAPRHKVSLQLSTEQTATYSLRTSPTSQTVSSPGSAVYTIFAEQQLGFNGTVSLSVAGLPSGVSASFGSSSISTGGSTVMTVSVTAGTGAGTYPLTISGVAGTALRQAQVFLTVPPSADFSITTSISNLTVVPSGSQKTQILLSSTGSFTGTVDFSASGGPAGTTISFSPSAVVGTGRTEMTITVPGGASLHRSYPVTINARSGASTRKKMVALTVGSSTDPILYVEPLPTTVSGPVWVQGWAVARGGALINSVQVSADGAADGGSLAGTATYRVSSRDIDADPALCTADITDQSDGRCRWVRFFYLLDTAKLADGNHNLTVTALDTTSAHSDSLPPLLQTYNPSAGASLPSSAEVELNISAIPLTQRSYLSASSYEVVERYSDSRQTAKTECAAGGGCLSYSSDDQISIAGQMVPTCPKGSSPRQCFQSAFSYYHSQGVKGVRLFFGFCHLDSDALLPCILNPDILRQWSAVRPNFSLTEPIAGNTEPPARRLGYALVYVRKDRGLLPSLWLETTI